MLDTGAHFYDVYECADGKYVSIGSIEPQFYAELLRLSGLEDDADMARQMDRDAWPALKDKIAATFREKTQAEWCEIMEHTDVCFAPVLTPEEAAQHPHNVARQTFVEVAGMTQAAPAPRFSRTTVEVQGPARHPGQDTDDVLTRFGYDADGIAKLKDVGAVV